MVKQKLIGLITFILALVVLFIYLVTFFYFNLTEIMSEEPIDILLAIYTILVDGLLGLVCGVLLYKGIKAGYFLGILIWGGAAVLHSYEIYFTSSLDGFDPTVHLEQYVILIDAIGLVTGIYFVKWLYDDLDKESSEQLGDLSNA